MAAVTTAPLSPDARFLRLLVLLRRYENQLDAETQAILERMAQQLVALLQAREPTAVSPGRVLARLDSLAKQADEILVKAYQELNAHARDQLVELASVQSRSVLRLLNEALSVQGLDLSLGGLPTRALLRSIVTTDVIRGAVMGDWWAQQRRLVQAAFRRELRIGMAQGESLSDLLIRIRGRAVGRGRYQGGVMGISTRNASALIRTATNEIANKAAMATYEANPDVVQHYEWLSTIDPRTCPECAALDGMTWALDDPKRRIPPAHFACRCSVLPLLDWKALGMKPPKTDRTLYPEWFKQQPASVQDQILGPSRAKLIRAGQTTFDDLVRRDGSMVTLAELEAEMVG